MNSGVAVSFGTRCFMLSGTKSAPSLLMKNWGSFDCTGFYFSVRVFDERPWLFLETVQFLGPNATPEEVASLLGKCCIECRQAQEVLQSTE